MEILPMGAELFHADGRTDWYAWQRVISFRNYDGGSCNIHINKYGRLQKLRLVKNMSYTRGIS